MRLTQKKFEEMMLAAIKRKNYDLDLWLYNISSVNTERLVRAWLDMILAKLENAGEVEQMKFEDLWKEINNG